MIQEHCLLPQGSSELLPRPLFAIGSFPSQAGSCCTPATPPQGRLPLPLTGLSRSPHLV